MFRFRELGVSMKVLVIVAFLALLGGCVVQFTPDPLEDANTSLDGDWAGERLVMTGGTSCRPSRVTARIQDGVAHLFVSGGTMILAAIVAPDGRMRFYRDTDERIDLYVAEPNADFTEISGVWSVNDTLCTGIWTMTRS